jgi:hypothetical protein
MMTCKRHLVSTDISDFKHYWWPRGRRQIESPQTTGLEAKDWLLKHELGSGRPCQQQKCGYGNNAKKGLGNMEGCWESW